LNGRGIAYDSLRYSRKASADHTSAIALDPNEPQFLRIERDATPGAAGLRPATWREPLPAAPKSVEPTEWFVVKLDEADGATIAGGEPAGPSPAGRVRGRIHDDD
jgi:hypothetical protein